MKTLIIAKKSFASWRLGVRPYNADTKIIVAFVV